MYKTELHPAFENELRGDITDTIEDWELNVILSNHPDRHKNFSGSGHPVNMVLEDLEEDERFHLDDDHSRPELYAWADRLSLSVKGFIEMVRHARKVLTDEESRQIALWYAGHLKDGEDPRFPSG